MAHAGQFGDYYTQVVDHFFHALEWRYNMISDKKGHERETQIVARLLDLLLSDQVVHEIELPKLEAALRNFQKIRHASFTPNKYMQIMTFLGIEEEKTHNYIPQLFGHVSLGLARIAG